MASAPAPLDAQSMSPVPSPTTAPSFAAPSLLRSGWRRLPHPIRWLGVAIAGGSVVLTGVVLLVLPGPGIPLILLGLGLAVSAYLLRPLATDLTGSVVARQAQDVSTGPLAAVFVDQLFDGWSSVSGALIAIGLSLILVGAVFSLRRSKN